MYNARMHPEQYSNTLSAAQISQLHKSIHYVCGLAVDLLADSSKFPEEWLFKHRWAKGKKDAPTTLPNGLKFVFMTVGGRTSAVVPSIQKKTGPVKKEIEANGEANGDDAEEEKPLKSARAGAKRKKSNRASDADMAAEQADIKPAASPSSNKRPKNKHTEDLDVLDHKDGVDSAQTNGQSGSAKHNKKKQRTKADTSSNNNSTSSKPTNQTTHTAVKEPISGRRRSARIHQTPS